jgi:NAD(P)-dependent dehydrogenase (short-subunit alcohol dehydrogenase family)
MTEVGELRFDGRVAVVTGAGGGLGRRYALDLAARGARVLVNDVGCAPTGDGASTAPADAVVGEIRSAGGVALADTTDVGAADGGDAIVGACLDAWGRVDVVVNNAGIVRPGPVATVGRAAFEAVLATHLHGSIAVAAGAWPHMAAAGYGRIVNTSSSSVFGTDHVSTYVAAKSAVLGLTTSMACEGAAAGIKVNAVMPTAMTRLTAGIPNDELRALLDQHFPPETVSPLVLLLAHADAPCSGAIFAAGGGHFARVALAIGQGHVTADLTPEAVRDAFDTVRDMAGGTFPASTDDATGFVMARVLGRAAAPGVAALRPATPGRS